MVHRLSHASHLVLPPQEIKYCMFFIGETPLQSETLPSREMHSLKDVAIVDMQFATSPLVRSSFGHHRGDV